MIQTLCIVYVSKKNSRLQYLCYLFYMFVFNATEGYWVKCLSLTH